MKSNVGSIDRIIRLLIGAALVIWGVMSDNVWGYIGLVPILTALIGWCPLYLPLKISTNKK
jgi:hypothetical protein